MRAPLNTYLALDSSGEAENTYLALVSSGEAENTYLALVSSGEAENTYLALVSSGASRLSTHLDQRFAFELEPFLILFYFFIKNKTKQNEYFDLDSVLQICGYQTFPCQGPPTLHVFGRRPPSENNCSRDDQKERFHLQNVPLKNIYLKI